MSQAVADLSMRQEFYNEKRPRKAGPFVESIISTLKCATKTAASKTPGFQPLQPEVRKIAITHCDAGGGGEKAVDGGH
jgi:hypothetical protein